MKKMILSTNQKRSTKRIILAFIVLTIIPLLVNFYVLSIFIGGNENSKAAPSVAASTSIKTNRSNNKNEPSLDFAIIGFAKTGTTFLHDILANHSQVIMYDDEFWGDGNMLRRWLNKTTVMAGNSSLNETNREQPQPTTKRRGIKCPRIVKETARLDQLLNNTSRVIVGVRHPVHWFESLYNYRIWQKHEKKRHNTKPPLKFLHNNRTDWLGLSTGAARFDLYLKQLGKVPLSPEELQHMSRINKVYGVMTSTAHHEQHPMKVLLYSMEQIKDSNTHRRLHFQHTLQQFLNLDTPLHDLATKEKVNVNNFQHSENIDICEEQYREIRNTLMWQGKHASEWIRNKFMKSEDVVVSDVGFINEVLERWGVDPCDEKSS
mmetsp:Transcript_28991/g.49383  ORF Transcript_28991/g.49383 Transcript_28991/m.49383 type:complete len:376 (-) Transcript_28991:1100-2227(-)